MEQVIRQMAYVIVEVAERSQNPQKAIKRYALTRTQLIRLFRHEEKLFVGSFLGLWVNHLPRKIKFVLGHGAIVA